MAELVVACFDTQFGANSAAEKLLSRGLRREQIVLTFDESVGNSAASSSAPTTVVSAVSHTGHTDTATGETVTKHWLPEIRSPASIPDPSVISHTTMVVELRGEISMDDTCALLEHAGATSINPTKQHEFVPEDPAMWPALGRASREDIERSIRASRRGAALKLDR